MQNKTLTLGSLFDGSGGFPLGGLLAGIEPVWASEIEPFPIRVTTKRLPFMKHYGDISQMDGGKIEPVDIITFGSPCQDMSVAGKRAGLDGSRSNLFHEAIRIVKEMRQKTNGKYPRYIVWENVPGAFSSNKGEDFRCVLEAVCRVKDDELSIPRPAKWPYAGCIMGDGFSIAWRQFDAQFWGVPQRRKRIYLVADFAGGSAGEILFESEGLSGYTPQSFRSWESITGDTADCFRETGCFGIDGYNSAMSDKAATLGVNCGMSTGRNGMLVLNDQGGNRMDVTEDKTCTLRAELEPTMVAKGPGAVAQLTFSSSKTSSFTEATEETANCLVATDYKDPPLINAEDGADYIVRRLTPTECARLQGFPDWWCSDLATEHPTSEEVYEWYKVFETHRKIIGSPNKPKTEKQIRDFLRDPHSDSAEYKMWGNGVALPCVYFVLSGIVWADGSAAKSNTQEEAQIIREV